MYFAKTKQVTVTTIQELAIQFNGNITVVSRVLGIRRATVYSVIKEDTPHLVLIKRSMDGTNTEYRYYREFGTETCRTAGDQS